VSRFALFQAAADEPSHQFRLDVFHVPAPPTVPLVAGAVPDHVRVAARAGDENAAIPRTMATRVRNGVFIEMRPS
jgi:hypothetical protein